MDDISITHDIELNVLNNLLSNTYQNILKLEISNNDIFECNFLDLSIYILENKTSTRQYSNTDYFDFEANKFPHSSSFTSIIL